MSAGRRSLDNDTTDHKHARPLAVIVVFGSLNVDLVVHVPRLPRPGETLAARSLSTLPGGKGANQALGSRRAGADVRMFGCVGCDEFASIALRNLRADGVDVTRVRETSGSTGLALIHVDDAGENCITVAAGANAEARAALIPDAWLARGTTVLMQLEVPIAEVAALAHRGRELGARIIVNAAPSQPLPVGLLDDIDILVVNEAEAAALTGDDPAMDARARCVRLVTPRRAVVVTLGARGALCATDTGLAERAAPRVDVVDSVGAGDAFVGALAAALDRGDSLSRAVREGVAAGSLACLQLGAQQALPTREAITRLASTLPAAG